MKIVNNDFIDFLIIIGIFAIRALGPGSTRTLLRAVRGFPSASEERVRECASSAKSLLEATPMGQETALFYSSCFGLAFDWSMVRASMSMIAAISHGMNQL
jgi:hypothetical protein